MNILNGEVNFAFSEINNKQKMGTAGQGIN